MMAKFIIGGGSNVRNEVLTFLIQTGSFSMGYIRE
jgi:hypothetical protein